MSFKLHPSVCACCFSNAILYLLLHLKIWRQVEGGGVMVDIAASIIVGVVAGVVANYIDDRIIHRNSR